MGGGEDERPLAYLNGAEGRIALEKLSGEMWKEITRIDGAIEGLERDVERTEKFNDRALEIAQTGLDKHLVTLNDNTAKLLAAQAQHARDMAEAQNRLQSIPAAALEKKETDARIARIEERQMASERASENLQGKLWFPMIVAAAIGVGIGAAIVKLVFH